MQLFARTPEKIFTFDLDDGCTVGHLRAAICERAGLSAEDQVLTYGTDLLDCNDVSLTALPNCATIDVTSRLLGGKVHGSLARAGKVRGQTPKVDKQEKKKKKVGRAKRRLQYNRRFVNVQMGGPGRKKGPNSNS